MVNVRKVASLLGKILLSILLIAWLVHGASPRKIGSAIAAADPWLLSTFVPLTLLAVWFAACQLKIITDCHGMNISLRRILAINFATAFYTLFLPGYIAGGAVRWYKLSRDNRMRAEAFAVIVLSRLLNTVVLLVWGLVGWLEDTNPARNIYIGLFLAGVLAVLVCGSVLLLQPWFASLVSRVVLNNAGITPWLREKMAKLLNAAAEYRALTFSARAKLVFHGSAQNLITALSTLFFLMALGLDVSFASVLWMQAVVGLAVLLPLTISGFGIREGSWIFLLGLYGVSPASAFVLSILTFVRNLFKGLIGMVIELRALFRGS